MQATQETCPVCLERALFRPMLRLGYGRICTCSVCGCGLLLPRPAPERLATLHTTEDYFDHPYFAKRREASPEVREAFDHRLRSIERFLGGGLAGKHLLDIGCDVGLFVQHAADAGMKSIGIDISERAVAYGRAKGRDLRTGTAEELAFADDAFDIVCAFDLVEHVSDPSAFFSEVRRILRPGGVLVLETPNYDGFVYGIGRVLGRMRLFDAALRPLQERLWPPFHIQYFTGSALRRAARSAGLEPLEVTGRELRPSELEVSGTLLRPALRALFAAGSWLRAPTLLVGVATKGPSIE